MIEMLKIELSGVRNDKLAHPHSGQQMRQCRGRSAHSRNGDGATSQARLRKLSQQALITREGATQLKVLRITRFGNQLTINGLFR